MSTAKMIQATLKPDLVRAAHRERAQDDVAVLVASLAANGIRALPDDVYEAWCRHSDTHAASWLTLYDDERANRDALLPHFDLER